MPTPYVSTLRGRIRKCKIRCWPRDCPNHYYCRDLPISTQALFSRNGGSYDVLEETLKEEGWLLSDEDLLEVLKDEKNLSRPHLRDYELDSDYGLPPDEIYEEEERLSL